MSEHIFIDNPTKISNDEKDTTSTAAGRNMHNKGNIYRLKCIENWYIVGKSNSKVGEKGKKREDTNTDTVPDLKLVG